MFAMLTACGNGEVRWCWGTEEWCEQHRPDEAREVPVGIVTDMDSSHTGYIYIDNRACDLAGAEIRRDDGAFVNKSEIQRGMTAEVISMEGAEDNPISVKKLLLQAPLMGAIESLDLSKRTLKVAGVEFLVDGKTVFDGITQAGLFDLEEGEKVQVYWLRGEREKNVPGIEACEAALLATRVGMALEVDEVKRLLTTGGKVLHNTRLR
jgi:hypothetical protein